MTAEFAKLFELSFVFDAFGDDFQVQIFGKRQNRADDFLALFFRIHSADERTINFQPFKREVMQIAQTGITRAEIVGADKNAERTEFGKNIEREIGIFHDHRFGDF